MSNLLLDPFAIGTLSIGIIAWIVALGGSIAMSTDTRSFPRFSWWGLVFQALLIIFITGVYMANDFRTYRLFLLACISIAFVYTSNSSNGVIYTSGSGPACAAAGFILLSIINFLWLIYVGSEPDAPLNQWIDSFSLRPTTQGAAYGVFGDESKEMRTHNSYLQGQGGFISSSHLNGLENTSNVLDRSLHDEPHNMGFEDAESMHDYPFTVRALYAYDANPEDINEMTFAKGEVFKVKDTEGRWWQGKKENGEIGICPSNYVEIID